MKKLIALFLFLAIASFINATVYINEFDTNTTAEEYLELYNDGGSAVNFATGQWCLVFVNGSGEVTYQATDLTGTIPAGGYYVIAESGVPSIGGYTVDQNASWTSFQNGTDAVTLVSGSPASNFPAGDYSDALSTSGGTQEDAVVYGTTADDPLDAEVGLSAGKLIANGSTGSSQRVTDGQGGVNDNWANSDWTITTRSPGAANGAAPIVDVANIAAARAQSVGTEIRITNTVIVTVDVDGLSTGRYQFYIQDSSGTDGQSAILVDDASATAGQSYVIGDVIPANTVVGTIATYSNMLELMPTQAWGAPSSGSAPAPLVLTGSENSEDIEAELVKLYGASVSAPGNWAANQNYSLVTPSGFPVDTIRIEDNSEWVGDPIPTGTFDVIGVVCQYSTSYQIQPRLDADLTDPSPVSDWTLY